MALYFRNERLAAAVTFGAPRMFNRLSAAIGSDQEAALLTADADTGN